MKNQLELWRWYENEPMEEYFMLADALDAFLSVKCTDGTRLYGEDLGNFDILIEAKNRGLDVGGWGYVYLQYPEKEAAAMLDFCERFEPAVLKVDAESEAKQNAVNLPRFLKTLMPAVRTVSPNTKVLLQSYRRPDYHRELRYDVWLTGSNHVNGLAPQAYFANTQDSVGDYAKMLEKHQSELGKFYDFRDNPFIPTLPIYEEYGWKPSTIALRDGIQYLKSEGLSTFSLWHADWLFEEGWQDTLEMLIDELGEPAEEPTEKQHRGGSKFPGIPV